jgi:hypothetical protein
LAAEDGEDCCIARYTLAEGYFEDGAVAEAYAELEQLAHEAALAEGPCTFVAELLTERGDLECALRWYDRAVARLVPEDLQALRGSAGWRHLSSVMIRGRREERAEARRRWRDEYDAPDEEYYPAAERRWRELASQGVPAIRVVPANVS